MRFLRWLHPALFIAALLAIWEIAVDFHPGQILPGPVSVAGGIVDLLQHGLLLKHVASLFRVTWGFVLAAVLAIPIGLTLGWYRRGEMAPPDVSGALAAHAIDAFVMGEPFPSQAEIGGFGRVLFQAREYWPDYMSCILVVRQDLIDKRPDVVQVLVDGIARSGLWLDTSKPHREDAADFVGRFYYNQKPGLLRWALTKPMDRVVYSPLAPRKADFDMVRDLMIETGVLNKKLEFS